MSKREYAAFLSYSHRQEYWAARLQKDLEVCLRRAGETRKVFRDATDIRSGTLWANEFQRGVERSDQVVLIVTPESLASPWVAAEWVRLVEDPHRLQIAKLIQTPLPPLLELVQSVDFRDHDQERYRRGLQRLLENLLPHSREFSSLVKEIIAPDPPPELVPTKLRMSLV